MIDLARRLSATRVHRGKGHVSVQTPREEALRDRRDTMNQSPMPSITDPMGFTCLRGGAFAALPIESYHLANSDQSQQGRIRDQAFPVKLQQLELPHEPWKILIVDHLFRNRYAWDLAPKAIE
jgi:hypothetical protein